MIGLLSEAEILSSSLLLRLSIDLIILLMVTEIIIATGMDTATLIAKSSNPT